MLPAEGKEPVVEGTLQGADVEVHSHGPIIGETQPTCDPGCGLSGTAAGFDRIREWEARYLPPEELDKYAGSIGHQPARE